MKKMVYLLVIVVVMFVGCSKENKVSSEQLLEQVSEEIKADPNDYDSYIEVAIAYKDLNKTKEALDNVEKAIKIKSDDAVAYGLKADILSMMEGQYDQALTFYNKAIELDPKNVEFYTNRGLLNNKLRNNLQALNDFDKAIELDDKYMLAYSNKAIVLENLGIYNEALTAIEKALVLEKNLEVERSRNYYIKGNILRKLNEYSKAVKSYQRSIQLNDTYIPAYESLVRLLHQNGRQKEASATISDGLKENPNNQQLLKLQKELGI